MKPNLTKPITVSAYYDFVPGAPEPAIVFRNYVSVTDGETTLESPEELQDLSWLPEAVDLYFCNDDTEPILLRQVESALDLATTGCLVYDAADQVERYKITHTFTTKELFPGGQCCPADFSFEEELKWSAWSSDESYWGGPDGKNPAWECLRSLEPGQSCEITVSSSKECRGGCVTITKHADAWHVSGHFTCFWDDLIDLADTLNVILLERSDFPTYFKDVDFCDRTGLDAALLRFLQERKGYSQETAESIVQSRPAVDDEEAFAETIPFSSHAMEPGVDRGFQFISAAGTVEELMAQIDEEEAALITESEEAWRDVEKCYERLAE